MTLNELIVQLQDKAAHGFGMQQVADSDGHPVIGVSSDEANTMNGAERVYIEAEF